MNTIFEKFSEEIKRAIFIRLFEELLLSLFNRGLLNGTVHTCVGQEITPVLVSNYLKQNDRIFSHHRGHGHFLASGGNFVDLLAELMGKANGVAGGIGGSQHIYNHNFISNGIQGGLTPAAVGFSYANKLKNNDAISISFIGDGTLGEGVLYEAMNLASVLDTPTLFILENNFYAQSTHHKETFAGSVAKRIEGFGIEYLSSNVWDLQDLDLKIKTAFEIVRNGKPAFLEVLCYRLNSHSKGDDNRDEKEISEYRKKDIINLFKEVKLHDYEIIHQEIVTTLNAAVQSCEALDARSTMPAFNYIYDYPVGNNDTFLDFSEKPERNNRLIYNGLKSILSKGNSVFIGEDIKYKSKYTDKPYGGAFKVSGDLSELFPDQVINSPISEQAIIGFGIGVALNGYKSIVEIMFGDFLTLGFDQILQQASKIPSMFGESIALPVIIRTPMGGRRGYGPTHSQNIERHFMFLPNISVIALNSLINARKIYENIDNYSNNPTIVIEDKISYTKFHPIERLVGYNAVYTDEYFPTVELKPKTGKANFILLVYGGMLDEVISILPEIMEEEIFPHIICPTSLVPFNIYPLKSALKDVKKVFFIEEGSKFGSFSSQIISYFVENKFEFELLGRLSNESIIPCAKEAEANTVPNSKLITEAFRTINI